MFKKLLFLFIVLILIISCIRATTRPSTSDLGTPPSEDGIPEIPDITPPDSQEDYYIKADDTEETIRSKIKKYYEKCDIYVALVDDTKDNIEKNKTIERINAIINEDIYSDGVFLDLSKTTMTEISDNSFTENKHLQYLKLPDTLTSIGDSAFLNAKKLTSINFPSTLTEIANYAFSSCINLQEVDLSYTQIKTIYSVYFDGCSKLSKIVLPNILSEIPENAFKNFESLTTIIFPSTLENIGQGAFFGCVNLQEVDLKDTMLKIIESQTFYGCSKLIKISFPDSLWGLDNSAFSSCTSLEEINFPENFGVIGNNVFSGCSKLKKVNLNSNIKYIYHYAFDGCTSLSSISLPSSLKELGKAGGTIFPNSGLVNVEYLGTDPKCYNYLW